jgi:acetyl-CoA acetyltransferase family protein
MPDALIVDAVRTPLAKRNGALAGWHPVDLAAEALRAVVERTGIDPALVEDVIMGCVCQTGEQALNVGRNAALAAGFPESVTGTTVDRQCGSSQQALHFAAQGVMAGAYDVVFAAGVESMSRVPMGATVVNGPGKPFGPRMSQRYHSAGGLVPQGLAADALARSYGFTREELDAYALESHRRAEKATAEKRFKREIVPITIETPTGRKKELKVDDGIRRDTSMSALASIKPSFAADGVTTAGNSSQITDGAAAVLIMSERRAEAFGLRPRARVVSFGLAGVDPVTMLTAAAPATTRALDRAGLALEELDVIEVNEAFAAVVLAWARDLDAPLDNVNVNGGAIALGHPLGATGVRMTATLVSELERRGGRYGLQAMCEGGGMANATVLERLS